MRIRPQTELAQVQKTLALNQAEAVARGRFDTALLQAAQGVRDSEGDAYAGLGPKAQQALAAALEELSGKSLSQLKDLANEPGGLAALVAGLAQGGSLSPAESARLGKLLGLALPRLMQAKTKSGSSDDATALDKSASGEDQGRDFFALLTGQEAALGAGAQGQPGAFASMAGALDGANQGLAGIQSGQAYGSFSGSSFGAGQTAGSYEGAVLPVSVNGNAVSLVANGQGQTSGAGQAQGADEETNATAPKSGSGQANIQNAEGADADLPAFLDLDVQILDVNAPLAVQPNSQVTLKGDNTWVYPQGAQTQTPKAQPQAQVQAQVPEQQLSVGAAGRTDGSAEAGLPVFGQTAFAAGTQNGAFETSPDAEPQGTSAAGLSDGRAGLAQALEQDAQIEAGADSGFSAGGNAAQTQPGTSNLATSLSGQGGSQIQGAVQGLGLGLNQPGSSNIQQGLRDGARGLSSDKDSAVQVGGSNTTNPGFDAALAALNQATSQDGGAAGQGPETPLTAGIVQAVTQALNQAGTSAPGRLLIQLSPAALGSVQVDLSLVDGKLTARLVAGQQDLRDALARDLSGFKAGLESHGVVVNEVSVALRSGVGNGQDNNPSRQDPQAPWRALAQTTSRTAAGTTAAAGLSAYGENAGGSLQGFSALA